MTLFHLKCFSSQNPAHFQVFNSFYLSLFTLHILNCSYLLQASQSCLMIRKQWEQTASLYLHEGWILCGHMTSQKQPQIQETSCAETAVSSVSLCCVRTWTSLFLCHVIILQPVNPAEVIHEASQGMKSSIFCDCTRLLLHHLIKPVRKI